MTDTAPSYPECEKLAAAAPESNRIGDFLDWLNEQGIHLAEWERQIECGYHSVADSERCVDGTLVDDELAGWTRPCGQCDGTGLVDRDEPILVLRHEPYEQLFARFYDIDLQKVDKERRAILDAIREADAGRHE